MLEQAEHVERCADLREDRDEDWRRVQWEDGSSPPEHHGNRRHGDEIDHEEHHRWDVPSCRGHVDILYHREKEKRERRRGRNRKNAST